MLDSAVSITACRAPTGVEVVEPPNLAASHPGRRRYGSTPVLTYIEYAPLRCYGAVTVPWRLSIITGELRKSIVGGPPNLASTIALHSPP